MRQPHHEATALFISARCVRVSIPYVDLGSYKFAYVYDFEGFLVELIEASTY